MPIRRIVFSAAIVAAGSFVAGAAAYVLAVRPWWRSWGADPDEADLPLAGDDLVPGALVSDTRGIDIAAPPEAVWPWLVQMGYGRGGWYSYDAMDMRGSSADRIVPDLQALAVGDAIPTSPDSSFVARIVDPGRALVLYVDDHAVREQADAARAAGAAGRTPEGTPANLRAAGAMMSPMSHFAASWALVLLPRDDGRGTRLLERVRVTMAPIGKGGDAARSFMGFGVFVMTRRQMLGLRDRVESRQGRGADGSIGPSGP